MITKNQTKDICSLHDKRGRQEKGLFIAEGKKLIGEILRSELECVEIYASPDWLEKNEKDIYEDVKLFDVAENELKKISTLTTTQEALAVVRIPKHILNPDTLIKSLSLVLDDISDPGNMGTIIRIADWFGIRDIICSTSCVDAFNPKVVQASMGSIARIRIHYTELLPFLRKNKDEWKIEVYAASLKGESIYSLKPAKSGLILMGNESRGIHADYESFIHKALHIPSYRHEENLLGQAESLNVAIATALICAEFRRR
jgi:TrmH family RNA methyltransferase